MTYKRTWITTVFLATGCVGPAPGPGEPPPGATGSDSTRMSAVESQISSTWKVLNIQYQVQSTGYWCGPAATRIALSARIAPPSQQTLADQLGTTTNGTDWIGQAITFNAQTPAATAVFQ
jgi:peptidase C39-like protein